MGFFEHLKFEKQPQILYTIDWDNINDLNDIKLVLRLHLEGYVFNEKALIDFPSSNKFLIKKNNKNNRLLSS